MATGSPKPKRKKIDLGTHDASQAHAHSLVAKGFGQRHFAPFAAVRCISEFRVPML